MPKPVVSSVSMYDADWVNVINSNFEMLYDDPFPLYTLNYPVPDKRADLFDNCICAFNHTIFMSINGEWVPKGTESIPFMDDLDVTTVTLPEIVTAFNSLKNSLIDKGWMSP